MLIVVAETTRSHRAGVSPQSGADARTGSTLTSILAPLAFGFCSRFPVLPRLRQRLSPITMRPAASNRRSPIAPMARLQVNIQTPSGAGVSRNVTASLMSMGAAWC